MFTGHVVNVPALAAKLPRGGETHLMLKFDRHAYTADGERVNDFRTERLERGCTARPWGDFTSPAIYVSNSQHRATLSGMLIEHRPAHRVMVAVKIGAIVEGIRRDLGSAQ